MNGCFRLGPAPFFFVLCCFASLATKRKSGWGICGSSCCVVLFLCLVVGDRFALWYWPIELGTTFHCLCLFQDRATVHLRPNSRKKKEPSDFPKESSAFFAHLRLFEDP